MQKFTVFSVVLSLIVVVMVAEIAVQEYFPDVRRKDATATTQQNKLIDLPKDLSIAQTTQTNVLDADQSISRVAMEGVAGGDEADLADNDFEDAGFVNFSPNAYIREDQLRSAGFVQATLQDEPADALLFKSVYLGDVDGLSMKKFGVIDTGESLVKIYVIKSDATDSVEKLFEVIAMRSADGLNVEINRTNEFGDMSFFMNDARRQGVAFLASKIGNVVYAFSYPKQYHEQVKNLIKLILWEK